MRRRRVAAWAAVPLAAALGAGGCTKQLYAGEPLPLEAAPAAPAPVDAAAPDRAGGDAEPHGE